MNLTILCKVVDNYGDIGFVWRLAKNLLKVNPEYKIRLVVSDLASFKKLCPSVQPELPRQNIFGMEVFDWNVAEVCTDAFTREKPKTILECFQCGRPDWLEEIIFSKDQSAPEEERKFFIINVEYLTAEPWADDFHCLKSGTRSALVKKVNFMPGFTEKTGGLILDGPFLSLQEIPNQVRNGGLSQLKILFFSYRNDFIAIFNAYRKFAIEIQLQYVASLRFASQRTTPSGAQSQICDKITVSIANSAFLSQLESQYVASLRFASQRTTPSGAQSQLEFQSQPQSQLEFNMLPFLSQEEWDGLMTKHDILFVRGEDSLSRACLCGKPFVWQAYPQDEDYQLVKVSALLDRMERHFKKEDFKVVKKFWLLYNGQDKEKADYHQMLEDACLEFLCAAQRTKNSFREFSKSLFALGNFSEKLDAFIKKNQATN